MRPLTGFELLRPRTLVGALEIMATLEGAQPIAGGTDLIPTFRDLGCKSRNLVDLGLIPELNYVFEEGRYVNIGPTTTHAQLQASNLIREKAQALHDAVDVLGSVQIRNRGTIGATCATPRRPPTRRRPCSCWTPRSPSPPSTTPGGCPSRNCSRGRR